MRIKECNDVKYVTYDTDIVIKKFNFSKSTAEDLNKTIAVYNKYNKQFKIDGSIIGELSVIFYLEYLWNMELKEALNILVKGNLQLNPVTKNNLTLDEY